MQYNLIVIGLAFDLIGFLIIFLFGGFAFGRSVLLLENDKSDKFKCFKYLGAILVVLGFSLQLIGTILKN